MSETYTTYGVGPDKHAGELHALREDVARLTKALQTIRKLYEVAADEMAYSIAKAALAQGKGGGE